MVDPSWFRFGPDFDRLPAGEPPTHAFPFGDTTNTQLALYISHETAQFIDAYVKANAEEEMCGLLVGYLGRKEERPFVVITGAIEARAAVSVPGGCRFTQATIEYFNRVREREYPDTFVLGWFHSHPGGPLSLSRFDQFMHHQLFDRAWQVTLVVDPIAESSQFYGWEGNRLVPLDAFYVFNGARHARELEPLRIAASQIAAGSFERAAQNESNPRPPRRQRGDANRRKHQRLASILAAVALLLVVVWARWPAPDVTHPEPADTPSHTSSMVANEGDALPPTGVVEAAAPSDAPSSADEQSDSAPPVTTRTTYTVQHGDTLWSISQQVFGNPYRFAELAELNGLDDPHRILPGMKLMVPISPVTPDSDDAEGTL